MKKSDNMAGRLGRAAGFLLVLLAAYALTLLALYLFAYSPYEAQNLASFGRYLSTYALAMLACCR